jgi:hypothetical protein
MGQMVPDHTASDESGQIADARLVETRKVGRVRTCQLRAAGLEPAMEWINQRHRVWSARLDHLDDYLKGQAT